MMKMKMKIMKKVSRRKKKIMIRKIVKMMMIPIKINLMKKNYLVKICEWIWFCDCKSLLINDINKIVRYFLTAKEGFC